MSRRGGRGKKGGQRKEDGRRTDPALQFLSPQTDSVSPISDTDTTQENGNGGTSKKRGSPGVGFMPHILDVKAGEDMLAKLTWFSQNSTTVLCVMSANGSVSNVTVSQSAASGGTVTYEVRVGVKKSFHYLMVQGRFEILSLSGSFMVAEVDGQRTRTGGLSVALSGPDGHVLGGNVAGLLIAASPVQVIVRR